MKNLKKKGFTIVELVIVIAVIAVLAAVLIPTFVNLTKKANISADQQAVRQMNVALATTEAATIEEAVAALDEAGYNALDSLTPVSTGYSFWWVEEYNSIVLLNEKAEVVFASNNDAKENFAAAKEAGKAFNLKRGLPEVEATDADSVKKAIANGQSVTLKSNLTINAEIVIAKGEDVVIDLAGYTLTTTESGGRHEYGFDNSGNVTIKNGIFEARGVENRGTLVIEEGVTVKALDSNGGACIWNYAGGEVIVEGGTFEAVAGDKEAGGTYEPGAINNAGKMTIKGGTFKNTNSGCYTVISSGELIIEGGTFEGWHGCICVNGGTASITGGTFKNNATSGYPLYISKGTVTVSGGTFTTASAVEMYVVEGATLKDNR